MNFEQVLKETSNSARGGSNFDDGASQNKSGRCMTGHANHRKFKKSWSPKGLDDITKDDMYGGKNYKKGK